MKPIYKLLIANRSEIARRIIRTSRRLGIATVAVYSDADKDALHVRESDASVALLGNASSDTYLDIDKIIRAAKSANADAVHPGYGFLSENANFAQAVIDAGLTWVGPPPDAIRALGSKSAAKALALSRNVPCLPGYFGTDQSNARLHAEALLMGLPIMVKAAAGGGGRGMRLVTDMTQLEAAVSSARSEALLSFGSGELLLERAILAPRHVEVQVFADAHGHCIHLGERDCSVQRRHQKIIEETPSPAISSALRERLHSAAVELALSAGYQGAGTVEFLVDSDTFYMMEMNTRLQVEHCVTEMVTGLDLVEWQLRVAQGEPLPITQSEVCFSGHAMEVRLCAEDENFTPHAGKVLHFREPRANLNLRFDHAMHTGLEVSPFYDSMLGKLVAHAPTRKEAMAKLASALDHTQVLGLPTNRAFLAACVRHPVFQAGQALIPFLNQYAEEIRNSLLKSELSMHSGYEGNSNSAHMMPRQSTVAIPLACPFTRPTRLRWRGEIVESTFTDVPTWIARFPDAHSVTLGAHRFHVQIGAVDAFMEDASFDPPAARGTGTTANDIRAPFNGKVLAVKAQVGHAVQLGEVLVIVESMKLEHTLCAARVGVVASIDVEVGQQVAPGQRLLSLAV